MERDRINDKQRQKIAFVAPSLDAGGAERFLLDLAINLDRSRFVPYLILFHHAGFFVAEARARGLEVVVLRKRFKIDPWNFYQLLKTLKQIRPDIVHTQLGGDIYGRLAARLLGIRAVVSVEHNVNPRESRTMTFIKKITAPLAARLVAVSSAVQEDMARRYGFNTEDIAVIYDGIDPDRFAFSERPARPAGTPITIGSIGRLVPQKNFSLLIAALAKVNFDFRCTIIGEGGSGGALAIGLLSYTALHLRNIEKLYRWLRENPDAVKMVFDATSAYVHVKHAEARPGEASSLKSGSDR